MPLKARNKDPLTEDGERGWIEVGSRNDGGQLPSVPNNLRIVEDRDTIRDQIRAVINRVRRTLNLEQRVNKPLWEVYGGRRGRGTTAVHSTTVTGPHCTTNEVRTWVYTSKMRRSADRQDGLGVVGDAVTLGSEVLHISKGVVAARILVICRKPLMLHFLKPVRLVLGCAPIA
jgi:hypothetical protein